MRRIQTGVIAVCLAAALLSGCVGSSAQSTASSTAASSAAASSISTTAVSANYDGGSGTQEDPYQINSVDSLLTFASNVNYGSQGGYAGVSFKLTSDLDLSGVEWAPIGNMNDMETHSTLFLGSFDGDGHTISNLNYTSDVYNCGAGLFGVSCGEVKNLTLENATVAVTEGTSMAIGGVVGYNMGSVDNVTLKGDSTITGNNCVGGIVGGNNNQGKTSVLDALAWALGGDRFRPDAAQRDGAVAPAHLKVKLSNGVVVERKGKNASLTVTDPTGRRSGQQLLNAFVEPLALDLPRFMEASDKEKADILLRIIGIGTELHTRDLEIKALYDKRTFTGQLAAQKKHFAEELISYPDAPEEPVSASDLIRQQQEILARNGENQRLRAQYTELERQEQQCVAELKRTRERIAELEQQYQELDAKHTRLFNQRKTAQKTVAQLQDESTAELEASIRDIEEINQKVRANLEKSRAENEAARYASDYDKLTEGITQKRADRMALLNGADLPLPELSVEDGALTYKGKHWRDMSGSDQLRVAAAIVRRLNPDCGFVLLDKLEQMDMTTLQEFSAWLEAEGLQAIATRVSTGSECQIIIEDGMVKDAETSLPPVTEKPQQKSWTKGAF